MAVLQLLPVSDLASRKRFKKVLPHSEIVMTEEWAATEEAFRQLFEEGAPPTDLTFSSHASSEEQVLLVEDLLHLYKPQQGNRLNKVRLSLPSSQLKNLLETDAKLSSFSEVAVPLEAATQELLPVLAKREVAMPVVLLVDATDLAVPVATLFEHMKVFGFQRVEVASLSPEMLQDFSQECVPLYRLPQEGGTVSLWKDCVAVLPLSSVS